MPDFETIADFLLKMQGKKGFEKFNIRDVKTFSEEDYQDSDLTPEEESKQVLKFFQREFKSSTSKKEKQVINKKEDKQEFLIYTLDFDIDEWGYCGSNNGGLNEVIFNQPGLALYKITKNNLKKGNISPAKKITNQYILNHFRKVKYADKQDLAILQSVFGERRNYNLDINETRFNPVQITALMQALDNSIRFISLSTARPIKILPAKLYSKVEDQKNRFVLNPTVEVFGKENQPIDLTQEKFYLFLADRPCLFLPKLSLILKLENSENYTQIKFLTEHNQLLPNDFKKFRKISLEESLTSLVFPKKQAPKEIVASEIIPQVFLSEEKDEIGSGKNAKTVNRLKFDLDFKYQPFGVKVNLFDSQLSFLTKHKDQEILFRRDIDFEKQQFNFLTKSVNLGSNILSEEFFLEGDEAVNFVVNKVNQLPENWEVFGQDKIKTYNYIKPSISFNVSLGQDWLEIEGGLDFGGEKISLPEVIRAINKQQKFIQLGKGKKGVLPKDWAKKHRDLFGIATKDKTGKLKINKHQAVLLEEFLKTSKQDSQEIKKIIKSAQKTKPLTKDKPPKNFLAKLRKYQQDGYCWLNFLQKNNFAGILADEMGLGKTIQTLAMLVDFYQNNPKSEASLLVVPKSLIFNWQEEVRRFAPSLEFHVHHGQDREKNFFKKHPKTKLVFTTYATLVRDLADLKNIKWSYLILDESQQIKNPHSQAYKAVKVLQSDFRLCLTGTPVENNLMDLWSQFNFLMPHFLGSMEYFKREFITPIQINYDKNQEKKLRKLTKPFILRRLKTQVAKDLKDKQENVIYVEMKGRQKQIYTQLQSTLKEEILKEIEEQGENKTRFKVLKALTRLRQVCCHPKLIDASSSAGSVKLDLLLEKIEEVVSENHKALVFSQFTSMLKIIEKELQKRQIQYSYLDGQTNKRQKQVEAFQNDPQKSIFLISLKAGGVGLNLTAADYVFIFDPWWNPAAENQAVDRTHRIGQDKQVFTYKLITKNSVEEKILKLQESKQKLVKNLISSENILKSLSTKEIKNLFDGK